MSKRRRRSFTHPFKVVHEILTVVHTQAEVGRQHGLEPEFVARGKGAALERLPTPSQGE